MLYLDAIKVNDVIKITNLYYKKSLFARILEIDGPNYLKSIIVGEQGDKFTVGAIEIFDLQYLSNTGAHDVNFASKAEIILYGDSYV